ncbi:unnamed protein product [Durusdinium trenchii]|uniref:N-acetyltransferase domain-containing protein n=1 Tax=Durusdinium trenchii TaxID=1381693 RepID=A0ABP0SWP8_9DINO
MVPTYHAWMQDPEILELTASEPLSLDEEYEMQQSWRDSEDKLTFILLDQSLQSSMAGDVNIFFGQGDDPEKLYELGEIEVMVAAPESRRKGIAREAVQLMQAFAAQFLGTKQFLAKIKDENVASQKLFESLGYVLEKHVEVFQEIHYRFHVNREDLTPIVTEELQEDHDLVLSASLPGLSAPGSFTRSRAGLSMQSRRCGAWDAGFCCISLGADVD